MCGMGVGSLCPMGWVWGLCIQWDGYGVPTSSGMGVGSPCPMGWLWGLRVPWDGYGVSAPPWGGGRPSVTPPPPWPHTVSSSPKSWMGSSTNTRSSLTRSGRSIRWDPRDPPPPQTPPSAPPRDPRHPLVVPWQIQNNWTYGETVDEEAKTHPMLRPYKTFSEKVPWMLCPGCGPPSHPIDSHLTPLIPIQPH